MKVKSRFNLEQEEQFEHDLAYAEYLHVNNTEPMEDEPRGIERVLRKASILYRHRQSCNNLHYQPLQGA